MNLALGSAVADKVLELSFEGQWSTFEKKLSSMPSINEETFVKRTTEDIGSEILEIARAQSDNISTLVSQVSHVESMLNRSPYSDSAEWNSIITGRYNPATMRLSDLANPPAKSFLSDLPRDIPAKNKDKDNNR
jgi:hypothetical protein